MQSVDKWTMNSITYGHVSFHEMCDLISEFMQKQPDNHYAISIGTDSQNFDITKTIIVAAVHRVGKGGVFFYHRRDVKKIKDVGQKIWFEASLSAEMANKLTEYLDVTNFDVDLSVHVDAGPNGKSARVIPEITAMIRSLGYDCKVKPESYASSAIANKISK